MISNRFKILNIIGEGGTSIVYRALDTKNNCIVAIKTHIIHKTDEHNILVNFKHEHIVNLKETQKIGENLMALVMEEYESDLLGFMNTYDVDLRCVKRIIRMVLLALKYLHDHGVIHRDVKMGNILIKDNNAVLCDFGLSCYESKCDYSYCGTRDYLAPEMLDHQKYNRKIDIYAVGVILKNMLAKQMGGKQVNDAGEMDTLLCNLLEKNPEKRADAEDALRNGVFGNLFVEIPDFRMIQDFSKCTKYGNIEKTQNTAKITVGTKQISILCRNTACLCKGEFIYDVYVDGNATDKCFLSASDLKCFNYLGTYLLMVASKTVVYKENRNAYEIRGYCDGAMEWLNGMVLAARVDRSGQWKDGHKMPDSDVIYVANKMKETCYCGCRVINETFSTIQCTMPTECISDNNFYEKNVGWCCKNGDDFLFLLNNGKKFRMLGAQKMLVVDELRYAIDRRVPPEMRVYLKVALLFLRKISSKINELC